MNELAKTLEDVFGFSSFRPGQEEIINHLMQKKKTLFAVKACLFTGTENL
ncbi:MAG: hypothetical protein CM15mP40_12740 [Alphaproteobacteria bacterium]|nr:MAG: hypothetical protein CM15mP40_12740 [Alphaproteobacteria bacterium]